MLRPESIDPCELLPHAGAMCLLQAVLHYDEETIACSAISHRDRNNPLRSHNQLSSINAIEYAAQAMAVHAGCAYLAQGERMPLKGFLASVRQVQCFEQRLDHLVDDLVISASRHALVADGFSYLFQVRAGDKPIMSGRLSIRVLKGDNSV